MAGLPVHVLAAWHWHNPAVSPLTYCHNQRDGLRADGAALFGRPTVGPRSAWDSIGTPGGSFRDCRNDKTRSDPVQSGFFLVGLTGLEPATT